MRFGQVGAVVCSGETMVVLVPAEQGPVHRVHTWTRAVGGAESDMACHLARLGVPSRPVGAVGQDAFGRAILDSVGGAGGNVIFRPALHVDVVEPVGVGDAFAAGYLAATLVGNHPERRFRAGHLQAAAALLSPEDVGDPLPAHVTENLLDTDQQTWAAARLRGRA